MSSSLLLEVGLEEVPAGYLAHNRHELEEKANALLEDARIEHGEVRVMSAPRRIALMVSSVAPAQQDRVEELVGPPARIAFDEEGNPTKAAMGFAKRNGVGIDELSRGPAPGKEGEYLLCNINEKGKSSLEILGELLPRLIESLSWPKSMRWGFRDDVFVRPVHWIVALLGDEVIPFELYGVKSGQQTRGHRFLSPEFREVTPQSYLGALTDGFVLIDPQQRKDVIQAGIAALEQSHGFVVREDDALVNEVVDLVEFPNPMVCSFEERFLAVPEDVIVSAMRKHQRYFATEVNGKLSNQFVVVAGTKVEDDTRIRKGNGKVIRARLSDAEFFFEEDRKQGFERWNEKLQQVVFQKDLGSVWDKVVRMQHVVSQWGAAAGGSDSFLARCHEAVTFCKSDLVSLMVGEFPELQGRMGGQYFCERFPDKEDIGDAIAGHYAPTGRGEMAGIVAACDRIDTLVGCFSIGLIPTGSADPFALRRAAAGILQTILEHSRTEGGDRKSSELDWTLPLRQLIQISMASFQGAVKDEDAVAEKLLEFFGVREKSVLGKFFPADIVDAVTGVRGSNDSLVDRYDRAMAVWRLQGNPQEYTSFVQAFKRVANILKKNKSDSSVVSKELFETPGGVEADLWNQFGLINQELESSTVGNNYDDVLRKLAELRPRVDTFFDGVMVMHEDEKIRNNRLAMLTAIHERFATIFDVRKISA